MVVKEDLAGVVFDADISSGINNFNFIYHRLGPRHVWIDVLKYMQKII